MLVKFDDEFATETALLTNDLGFSFPVRQSQFSRYLETEGSSSDRGELECRGRKLVSMLKNYGHKISKIELVQIIPFEL